MEQNHRDLMLAMQAQLKNQAEFIDAINQRASYVGTVHVVDETTGRVLVAIGNEIRECGKPAVPVKPGQSVTLAPSGQILRVHEERHPGGVIATVERVLGDQSEVTLGGHNVLVLNLGVTPKPKDLVILDKSMSAVLATIEPSDASDLGQDSFVQVAWDEVGGLAEAKRDLIEAVTQPYEFPEVYKFYGQTPPRGALLYGPPGNGKTLLAKAIATKLGDGKGAFLAIKGPEVINPFVGVTERAIREKFANMRRYHQRTGKPAVLFVDEAEALLSTRHNNPGHAMVQQTIVPTFLTEMDGMDGSAGFVILATNRPEMLDPAIIRDGRIDRKIEISRPSQDDAKEVLAIHLANAPIAAGEDKDALINWTAEVVYDERTTVGTNGNMRPLSHIVSNAMLAGITQHARASAIRRDLVNTAEHSGVGSLDMHSAIARVIKENATVNHA